MPNHSYVRVSWHHNSSSDPIELWSELDLQRFERRKVEVFADGRMQNVGMDSEAKGSFLGTVPIPSVAQLNADPQFTAEEVPRAEFEKLWRSASAS